MSPITTRAPSSTKRRAVARPMPEHPPVTTATLPSMRPAMCGPFVSLVEEVAQQPSRDLV
jgi:hypothetical protein